MDDDRVWAFEDSLWKATPEHYAESISDECVTVVPSEPHLLTGREWIDAAQTTPRWSSVEFSERRVSRPQEGLIVIGYRVAAARDGEQPYEAWCTSTYQRLAHERWVVIQHQQTPPLVAKQSANT